MTRPDDDPDARAFRDGADAIEALLDAPIAVAVQHAPRRGRLGPLCGAAGGQVSSMGIGVTCDACLRARRARR